MSPDDYIRVVFGLLAVLGMIGIGAVIARKAGLLSAPARLLRQRRLNVVETMSLDAKRRLMIVRCDDREHFLVLGAQSETVIESMDAVPLPVDAEKPSGNPFADLRAAAMRAAKREPAQAA